MACIVRINALLNRRIGKRFDLYGVICLAVFVLMSVKALLWLRAPPEMHGSDMARQVNEVYSLSAFFCTMLALLRISSGCKIDLDHVALAPLSIAERFALQMASWLFDRSNLALYLPALLFYAGLLRIGLAPALFALGHWLLFYHSWLLGLIIIHLLFYKKVASHRRQLALIHALLIWLFILFADSGTGYSRLLQLTVSGTICERAFSLLPLFLIVLPECIFVLILIRFRFYAKSFRPDPL